MDLICHLHPSWRPLIRPASAKRDWMDATPESFAYRCLPLNIANAHGWEVLAPDEFDAVWNGGTGTDAITIRGPADADPITAPVSIFGQGVLTFHVPGLFRTPAGWNMWVGGPPNQPKDGIFPLTGVVETDWSPFTFTMNWRFTRPNHWVRFEKGESICFIFPVQRDALEAFEPRFAALEDEPGLVERFDAWSQARNAFHEKMQRDPPKTPADRWQKHYYRGVDAHEQAHIPDHRTKLRLRPFAGRGAPPAPPEPPVAERSLRAPASRPAAPRPATPPIQAPPVQAPPPEEAPALTQELERLRPELRRRDWLANALEQQRALAPGLVELERRTNLDPESFLERYYAPARPVILLGEMQGWPALTRWTPEHLASVFGPPGRAPDPAARASLVQDQRPLSKFLSPEGPNPEGVLAAGPAGAGLPAARELANALFAQVVGRQTVRLAPPAEGPSHEITLEPGEILFLPLGWRRELRALDFSVMLTFTNFRWPNAAARSFPAQA